jgi:tyrosyl-tRNA synthetase
MIQNNGVSINKDKVGLDKTLNSDDLLLGQYILLQKGKKNYYLIRID